MKSLFCMILFISFCKYSNAQSKAPALQQLTMPALKCDTMGRYVVYKPSQHYVAAVSCPVYCPDIYYSQFQSGVTLSGDILRKFPIETLIAIYCR
jgi:hypothetical protein